MADVPDYPLDAEEMKRRLGKMREAFRSKAPARIAAIQLLWERVKEAGPHDEVREELTHAAHTLCGSAGTLGCEDLAMAARQLEYALRTLFTPQRSLSDGDRAAIGRLVDALGKSLG